ncbi:unnamed protein product [marine sediment metagenome]|uniref:Uncharacterized protein n=1 Tax=marine sediment metagenome TaxID=412755 RepID=X1IAX3_9ZZZZ
MVKTLWNGFKASDLVQGILAIGLAATICFCVIVDRAVPMELFGALMLILGFYFRTRNNTQGG